MFICIGDSVVPGCGAVLTDEERHYYEISCERCTRARDAAVTEWMKGAPNAKLDAMFDEPRPVLQ